ncbi:molecular chaperone [Enterobacter cloacae]|uniref:fimbrial biogenesis chaperone n=1 Tax=Enterobacter cloacae TaxID=550 RepID=UPI0018C34130|nr:molecular chaperone [Enterobacter cloacae]MBG0522556.1 molecular chaperone [Enterobacter cloacae]
MMKSYVYLAAFLFCGSSVSHAAINLDRTRIVFSASDKASSLTIDNQSKSLPYLALAWVEDQKGRKEDSHFMVLPPIQRIEPGTSSQVRIVKQAATQQLPQDRETLFYFNLREVPPKSTNLKEARSVMQVAMQSRIKLFWRPENIRKKTGEETEMQLAVTLSGNTMRLKNPTPYFITLAWLSNNDKTMMPGFDSLMIDPFATSTLTLSESQGTGYSIGYIDDYGALRKVNLTCSGSTLCTLAPRKAGQNATTR